MKFLDQAMRGTCSVLCTAALFLLYAGCSDSSSSDPVGTSESMSSASTVNSSSAGADDESSDVVADEHLGIAPDVDGFFDIGDIYRAVPKTNSIVFVLRHAERESGLDKLTNLTENGVAQSLAVGKKLAGDESFYYASTDFVRTRETCNNIAKGRGESAEVVTWEGLNGGYFLKVPSDSLDSYASARGGSWKIISRWAYADPNLSGKLAEDINGLFYDIFERGDQFINENIVPNISKWKRVSVLISHDVLLEPLIVYASNRAIDLKFYDGGKWVNYLSGVAIIVDEKQKASLYPVRGNDVGYMYTGLKAESASSSK